MANRKPSKSTFWQELRERAGFVGVIAVTNPIILTVYVLYGRTGPGAFDFWLIGMMLTLLVCVISSLFMVMVVIAERRRRFSAERKAAMWADVMPYNPAKAKASETAEGS